MQSTSLFYSDLATGGTSDKEYHIQIEPVGDKFVVNFQFGRRGGPLQTGTKTKEPVSFAEAEKEYERTVREKLGKGYLGAEASGPLAPHLPPIGTRNGNIKTKYPVELLTDIGHEQAEACLKSSKYWLQKKLDGHRVQLERKADGTVLMYNRKGEIIPVPHEVAKSCAVLPWDTFLLDGELVSKSYFAFDLLEASGVSYADKKFSDRYFELNTLRGTGNHIQVCPTWITVKAKVAASAELFVARAEGLVFKSTEAKYKAGRNGQHLKFKFLKTATCKVLELGLKGHDNAALGLFDGKKWVNVGGASMIGKDKRIKVGSLVEVKFLYVTEGNRLYQPRIIGLRTDVDESACTFAQFKHAYKEGVDA